MHHEVKPEEFTRNSPALRHLRAELLAARPADGKMPEPPVCVCHAVGANQIRHAIAAGNGDLDAIGRATRAGTNCGSCRPEIRALLQAAQPLEIV